MAARDRLKSRMLKLLKEDEEFRYAVTGLMDQFRSDQASSVGALHLKVFATVFAPTLPTLSPHR